MKQQHKNLKIYFAGSIRGGRDDASTYLELINYLKNFGKVLTEHVGSLDLTNQGEKLPLIHIHNRDLDWLLDCDVLIAEISTPSLGVGYEIGRAIEHKKKVLCIYSDKKGETVSGIIRGCPDIISVSYSTIERAENTISNFMKTIV